MRRVEFAAEEIYHVYNRGVEKRDVFLSAADYQRFVYSLVVCNSKKPVLNSQFHYRGLASIQKLVPTDLVVDVLAFCLMPNHYHLLLRQRVERGISVLMQKAGTAYTMYFNTKYARVGALFQGVYKARRIPRDGDLHAVSKYIHLNPLDLIDSAWKERGVRNRQRARRFLREYPWSSFGDHTGTTQRYPFLVNTQSLAPFLLVGREYAAFVERWSLDDARVVAPYAIDASIEVRPR